MRSIESARSAEGGRADGHEGLAVCANPRDAPFSAAVMIATNSSGAAPCGSAPVATAGTSFGSSPQLNSRPMPATDGMVEVCLVASNATARSAESRANPRESRPRRLFHFGLEKWRPKKKKQIARRLTDRWVCGLFTRQIVVDFGEVVKDY